MRETIADSRAVLIGAGVVGCAIFRRLAMAGLEPIMLEAAADILDGASKGNSALLHTGFDAPEGSIELLVELGLLDLDGDLDLVAFEGLDSALHEGRV